MNQIYFISIIDDSENRLSLTQLEGISSPIKDLIVLEELLVQIKLFHNWEI